MWRANKIGVALLAFAALLSCQPTHATVDSATATAAESPVDSGFASVPDSAWVDVQGATLVGFYPIRSNEQLENDSDLATALDDFAYHIGAAMDSLIAAGMTVQYRGGDTVWFRADETRWRVARHPDSADVGYVFADTARNTSLVYGVRTYVDLIEYAHEFTRTGRVRPR